MPGGDIFGFTSGADVGDPCIWTYSSENSFRSDRADGSYFVWNHKSELSYSFNDRFGMSVSLFKTYTNWSSVTAATNAAPNGETSVSGLGFDGISFEPFWGMIKRSSHQPFAFMISAEPRWSRIDGLTGLGATGYSVEVKLLGDVVITPDLYAAVNTTYNLGTTTFDNAGSVGAEASQLLGSAALTYRAYHAPSSKFLTAVYLGVEARYLRSYTGVGLNSFTGAAFFAGPTLALEFANDSMLNLVWTPQLAGGAVTPTLPANRDLDNFDAHVFRIKYSIDLN